MALGIAGQGIRSLILAGCCALLRTRSRCDEQAAVIIAHHFNPTGAKGYCPCAGGFTLRVQNLTTRRVAYSCLAYRSVPSVARIFLMIARTAVRRPLTEHSAFKSQRRCWAALSTILTPPAVFGGIFLTLWIYKCCMMILFQNKIIYMPFIPPFSRSEKVADYVRQCQPVAWREHRIQSLDGTSISLLVGAMKPGASKATARSTMYESEKAQQGMVIIAYFQG